MTKLSTKQRYEIVFRNDQNQSVSYIATQMNITNATASHWIHHYKTYANVDDLKKTGRNKIDRNNINQILLSENKKNLTAKELVEILKKQNNEISLRTAYNILKEKE